MRSLFLNFSLRLNVNHELHNKKGNKGENESINIINVVKPQLIELGKTMSSEDITFKDFCVIVKSNAFILSLMKLNVKEEKKKLEEKKNGEVDGGETSGKSKGSDRVAQRRRSVTVGF